MIKTRLKSLLEKFISVKGVAVIATFVLVFVFKLDPIYGFAAVWSMVGAREILKLRDIYNNEEKK